MLNKRLEKLYQHLSEKEKAALSIELVWSKNDAELTKVTDCVKTEMTIMNSHEFRINLNNFQTFAHVWAILHLKTYSSYQTSLMAFISSDSDDENHENYLVNIQQQKQRLVAIDNVLNDLCLKHGLNPDSLRNSLEIEKFQAEEDLPPALEYQQELYEMYDKKLLSYTH